MEPEQLRRGKEFHQRVQEDWRGTMEGASVRIEKTIPLHPDSESVNHIRHGRMDLFVDQLKDFVTVIEIKSTNWDEVKEQNYVKLLGSHRRQVLRYVDKFLNVDKTNVCAAIIYPRAPKKNGLKLKVKNYLNDYGIQVVWYEKGKK